MQTSLYYKGKVTCVHGHIGFLICTAGHVIRLKMYTLHSFCNILTRADIRSHSPKRNHAVCPGIA